MDKDLLRRVCLDVRQRLDDIKLTRETRQIVQVWAHPEDLGRS